MDWMSDDESVQSIDFDTFGQWDVDKAKGPAIHIPDDIKNIIITRYRIEWLNLSDPAQDIYAKNHMVAVAVFAQPVTINDVRYESARISMELGPNLYVAIESVGDVRSLLSIYPFLNLTLISSTRIGHLGSITPQESIRFLSRRTRGGPIAAFTSSLTT